MQKFCDFDRKYQLAVQYAIWDRIKDIQSHSVTQSKNLAQLIVHLVSSAAQPISILKIVEFGALDKTLVRLVRQVLLGILLAKEELCKEVNSDHLLSLSRHIFLLSIVRFATGVSANRAQW